MNQLSNYPHLLNYVSHLRLIPHGKLLWSGVYDRSFSGPYTCLDSFRIGSTPVTWGMWKEYWYSSGSKLPVVPAWGWLDDHPVVNVSWNDVTQTNGFTEWASSVAGIQFQLPTEVQFEYSVCGGFAGQFYPWGNVYVDENLWCSAETSRECTAPVNRTNNVYRNAFGLTDLVGNVFEWCANPRIRYTTGRIGSNSYIQLDKCVRGCSWACNDVSYRQRRSYNPSSASA